MPKAVLSKLGASTSRSPLADILSSARNSRQKQQDELLLQSSGPVTDLSGFSMMPCLDSVRVLMFEPEGGLEGHALSAIGGEAALSTPPPLVVVIQESDGASWKTIGHRSARTLAEAMDIAASLEVTPENSSDFPICPGGFAGTLGYDLSRWSVPIAISNPPSPGTLLGVLWRTDAWMLHDRSSDEISVIALEGHEWLDDPPRFTGPQTRTPVPRGVVPNSESDSEHASKVSRIQEGIVSGNLYQVNYGRRWNGPMDSHPWEAFVRLSDSNPAPFSSWMMVSDHGWSVASSSPERLIRVDEGTVSTRPIKGTRKRGIDDQSDNELRHELASSPKEIAEHLMLVDLERHDLSKICVSGSVYWSDWRIEALANVQHLVSGIQGELSESINAGRAVAEMFPGGSVTGCPKTVTLAAIDELEGSPRGAWTGSMGHVHSGAGIADWNILIRTLEAHTGPHCWHGTVQAGGGIVIGSSPSEEVEEARWKAAAVTESAWGFRTGFSDTDLPEGEVAIIPFPAVDGPISKLSPGKKCHTDRISQIHREVRETPEGSTILVDNLDSFTENIAQSLAILGSEVLVVEGRPEIEGDPSVTLDQWLEQIRPSRIVLGPGPARPEVSPITMEIARRAVSGNLLVESRAIPVLGLCLGHQALGVAAGWDLVKSPLGAVHGIPSVTINDGSGLYYGMDENLVMMRYNSLVLEQSNDLLIPNSWDETASLLMGLRHASLPIHGIQFHPESVGSPRGMEILSAFLETTPVEQHHGSELQST